MTCVCLAGARRYLSIVLHSDYSHRPLLPKNDLPAARDLVSNVTVTSLSSHSIAWFVCVFVSSFVSQERALTSQKARWSSLNVVPSWKIQ